VLIAEIDECETINSEVAGIDEANVLRAADFVEFDQILFIIVI
jgi:hypothetical protein